MLFRSLFIVSFRSDLPDFFVCGPKFLQETLPQCFINCLVCTSFCVINEKLNLAHNQGFLLQTKCKATDKTLVHCYME